MRELKTVTIRISKFVSVSDENRSAYLTKNQYSRFNQTHQMKRISLFSIIFFGSFTLFAQSIESRLQHMVDSIYALHPNAVGVMVDVESPGEHVSWSYAVGYSDKNVKTKISPSQPALIASNVKTFVSATILRLVEMKKINLQQPIGSVISKSSQKQLFAKGYKTEKITIAQLLSHTSGIGDYVNDDYFKFVNEHRQYKWTRNEQIRRAMEVSNPLSLPGDTFSYADINYLLLSEIIETCTHKPFYEAIRELIDYKTQNMNTTWFTTLEKVPVGTQPLVHQYWDKYPWDSYDLDPSWDLYGGGGIASTTKDLAVFFLKLFEGNIIQDKEVLNQMFTNVPAKTKTNYCLGLRKISMGGYTGYYHGGFWGTDAIYFPELRASVAIYILEKSQRDLSADICKQVAVILNAGRTK